MKFIVYIHNQDSFLNGEYSLSLAVAETKFYNEYMSEEFQANNPKVCDIDIDIDNVDIETVKQSAIAVVDAEVDKVRAEFDIKMQLLENKKASYLAITHKPGEWTAE